MKKARVMAGIAAFALAALAAGILLYRHFVTDRIMDGGDMTNPFLTQEEVSPVLPEGEELVFLLWLRSAMSYDDSCRFFLSNAETDRIDMTWKEADGTERSAAFDGTDATPLLALLKEIARETALEQ